MHEHIRERLPQAETVCHKVVKAENALKMQVKPAAAYKVKQPEYKVDNQQVFCDGRDIGPKSVSIFHTIVNK